MEACQIRGIDEYDDQGTEKPSVLAILVDKHQAIEQSVCLIKEEIREIGAAGAVSKPDEAKFEGLNSLFSDPKVKEMVRSVAGEDTQNVICDALGAINSSTSVENKKKALSSGLQKLKSNLVKPDKKTIVEGPTFNLMLDLVGANREKHSRGEIL